MRIGLRWCGGEQNIERAQNAACELVIRFLTDQVSNKEKKHIYNVVSFVLGHAEFTERTKWHLKKQSSQFLNAKQLSAIGGVSAGAFPSEVCYEPILPNNHFCIDHYASKEEIRELYDLSDSD